MSKSTVYMVASAYDFRYNCADTNVPESEQEGLSGLEVSSFHAAGLC